MNLSAHTKLFWTFLLSILMTDVPAVAFAETAQQMIPTAVVVEQLSRQQAEERVRNFISREDVREEFLRRGVAPEEVSNRLASLSENELQNLATQMDEARYGGNVGGILIVVLLVVLIIFLVRRI